jgi:hypothetical protein
VALDIHLDQLGRGLAPTHGRIVISYGHCIYMRAVAMQHAGFGSGLNGLHFGTWLYADISYDPS